MASKEEQQGIELGDVAANNGDPELSPAHQPPLNSNEINTAYSIVEKSPESTHSHDLHHPHNKLLAHTNSPDHSTDTSSNLDLHALSADHSITWKIKLLFILFGFGPSWMLSDGMFIQIPYWQRYQPEALSLANKMTVSSFIPLVTVVPIYFIVVNNIGNTQLSFRKLSYFLIALQILCTVFISFGWPYTIGDVSIVIHFTIFISSFVGNMMLIAIVPWVTCINNKLSAPILTGTNLGTLCTAIFGIIQQPGNEQPRFGPSLFFAIFLLFFIVSTLAFVYLDIKYLKEIEKVLQNQGRNTHRMAMVKRREKYANSKCSRLQIYVLSAFSVPVWWREIFGFTVMYAYVTLVTWVFIRSSVPFAIKHASTAEQGDNTEMEQYAIELSYVAVLLGSVLAIFLVIKQYKYFVALIIVYSIFAVVFVIVSVDNKSGLWVFWNSDKLVVALVFLMRCIDGYVAPLIYENIAHQYPDKAHAMNQWISITAAIAAFIGVWVTYLLVTFHIE